MKDPAALFYIDTWLSATAEMDADVRGWYLNLILHNYDKKDLPNDIEKLAVLAGVKFSEFERFKQVFEQVLKHKFSLNDNNRLENNYAKHIIQSRELFKEKRSKSGNIGVIIKIAKSIEGFTENYIEQLKNHLFTLDTDEIDKHKDKQMLHQMLKLYINGNGNGNKDLNKSFLNSGIEEKKIKLKNESLEILKNLEPNKKNLLNQAGIKTPIVYQTERGNICELATMTYKAFYEDDSFIELSMQKHRKSRDVIMAQIKAFLLQIQLNEEYKQKNTVKEIKTHCTNFLNRTITY